MNEKSVVKDVKEIEITVTKIIPILTLIIFGLWLFFGLFTIVDAGNVGIQKTFGEVNEEPLGEGLHLKAPWTQIIQLSYQTQRRDADASSASNDLQDVRSTVAVNYHLNKDSAVKMYREVGTDYAERLIPQAIQGSVKSITAKFTAEELITNRPSVRAGIEQQLREDLLKYGIITEKVEIVNFNFSESFNNAIEAKVTAQQRALEAENVLKQIQFEALQKVAEAKGLADSKVLQANADANAILVTAQAQAEALRIQNEALSKNQDVLQLRLIEKWNGQYPTYYWVGNEGSALVQIPSINSSN